ncbi:MAG: hypothetical protein VW270_05620 [Candidatus Poseidoniales archaeon]
MFFSILISFLIYGVFFSPFVKPNEYDDCNVDGTRSGEGDSFFQSAMFLSMEE